MENMDVNEIEIGVYPNPSESDDLMAMVRFSRLSLFTNVMELLFAKL